MTTLHLAALPSQTTKGTIVRLLEQVGQINRDKIGEIQLRGRECQRRCLDWRVHGYPLPPGVLAG